MMNRKWFFPIVAGGLVILLGGGYYFSESHRSGQEGEGLQKVTSEDPASEPVESSVVPVIQKPDSASLDHIEGEARQIETVQSLLVHQNGELLLERYYRGMSRERTTNIKSASKSLLGLLAGIAIEEGFIESVDQPIRPYFKEYFESNPDSAKESITIQDLLTMRAGLETTSFGNYGRWVTSSNWVDFVLSQPLEEEPGGRMVYSTGTSHLLSVVLTKATGMNTRRFAQQYFFDPMGISPGGWDRDPQGYYMGGNNVALRPVDMLKIGQMVLNEGVWEGQRIVSEEWLSESFQTYTRSNFNPYDYGYGWWKKPIEGYDSVFAWGSGGQYIFMFPELNSVVVITSTLSTDQRRRYKEPVFDLVEHSIIPAISQVL